ncbi:hypothetical protein QYE77_14270 [Thermanaerothrix sp. 4228-RoL]|jgi:hypothetical protein|uniref:Uncharacterized protein n=1 Tax=Thermanaerothrix solaris TaxID=3058434 RepID=A0ABU3NRG2_9CHLR|nr:hypothetical protein [Thermanaerothrix sp. 4228-RoL]MDT8899426.1 hypothetical protein [Thermanaerothrix sp. 4228-RoL]
MSDTSRDITRLDLINYFFITGHLWLELLLDRAQPQFAEWLRRARYFDTTDRGSVNPADLIAHAYSAAAQLGLPLTFSTVRSLLLDRNFFFTHLPVPPDDPLWNFGRDYGVGFILWFWWQSQETEPFRQQLAEQFSSIPESIDLSLFLFWPALPKEYIDDFRSLHHRFYSHLQNKLL